MPGSAVGDRQECVQEVGGLGLVSLTEEGGSLTQTDSHTHTHPTFSTHFQRCRRRAADGPHFQPRVSDDRAQNVPQSLSNPWSRGVKLRRARSGHDSSSASHARSERRNVCVGCDSHWLMGSAPWTPPGGVPAASPEASAVCSLMTPSTTPSFCLAAHPALTPIVCIHSGFSGETCRNQSAKFCLLWWNRKEPVSKNTSPGKSETLSSPWPPPSARYLRVD